MCFLLSLNVSDAAKLQWLSEREVERVEIGKKMVGKDEQLPMTAIQSSKKTCTYSHTPNDQSNLVV